MTFQCQFCTKPYATGERHECSMEDLKARAVAANKSIDAFIDVMRDRMAWTFSLDGSVTVKVAFYFPDSVRLSKQLKRRDNFEATANFVIAQPYILDYLVRDLGSIEAAAVRLTAMEMFARALQLQMQRGV